MTAPGGLSRLQRVPIATVVSKLNNCLYCVESHEHDLREEIGDEEIGRKIQEDYNLVDLGQKTERFLILPGS